MTTSAEPTKSKDRIIFLDVLRGFALSGILFANILSWSGYKFLPTAALLKLGNTVYDNQLYFILKFFIDTKFYTIFSILFGIGFYMQLSKNKNNALFPALYFRRMCLLLVIGLFHAVFWSGDILTLYAVIGMLLLAMRNVSPSKLLPLAIVFYFTPVLLDIIYMFSFASELPALEKTAIKVYPDMSPEQIVNGFRSEDLLRVLKTNLHNLYWRWYDFIPSGRPFKILGLFFLGSYLYNIRFFTVAALKWKNTILFGILGFGITFVSMKLHGNASAFSKNWAEVLTRFIHELGQINLSLFYISFLAILLNYTPNFFLFRWLKNYGRMSFSLIL